VRAIFRSQNLDLPGGFARWATERAALLLRHHERLVRGVVLHLSDVDGPRGGADVHCRAVARLRGLGEVATAGVGTDAGLAVEDCLARLECAVDRATRRAHRPGFDHLLRRLGGTASA
jgi:hypothetical protein